MRHYKVLFCSFLIVILLISSGISAFVVDFKPQKNNENNIETFTISKQFSDPIIKSRTNFINIYLEESNSYIKKGGEPVIPYYREIFEFPLGTHIIDIKYFISQIKETKISKDIIPSSKPGIFYNEKSEYLMEKKESVYENDNYYPENWYSYITTGGLNKKDQLTTFLKLQLNPVRYNPVKKCLQSVNYIKIEITYEKPNEIIFNNDEYDLLIISYDLYTPILKPLVEHKNSHSVKTKLVSLSSINKNTSLDGRDSAEKVKKFIKDSIEKWGIKYVMLVGNFRKFAI